MERLLDGADEALVHAYDLLASIHHGCQRELRGILLFGLQPIVCQALASDEGTSRREPYSLTADQRDN
jgi:hypothetical protein